MVATSGRGWRLAPSLVALFDQADARWPDRSTASDGSIGDPAHAARVSDHNPDASGDVLAGDLTHDPAHGVDTYAIAEHLRTVRDRRVKYVISNRRKFASYPTSTRPAWTWGSYTGDNPHDHHVHVSVLDTPEARNDLRPWFPPQDGNSNAGDDMPLSDDDINRIATVVAEVLRSEGVSEGVSVIRSQVGGPDSPVPYNVRLTAKAVPGVDEDRIKR